MPDATKMAGVNMRLEAGAYRELHWHLAGEWSLVLNGSCRIQVWGTWLFMSGTNTYMSSLGC